MTQHDILQHYRQVHAQMVAHIEWMKSGTVTFHENSPDGVREDVTQRYVTEAEARADSLAHVIAAHERLLGDEISPPGRPA